MSSCQRVAVGARCWFVSEALLCQVRPFGPATGELLEHGEPKKLAQVTELLRSDPQSLHICFDERDSQLGEVLDALKEQFALPVGRDMEPVPLASADGSDKGTFYVFRPMTFCRKGDYRVILVRRDPRR